jgi:hypothetical protein
MLGWLSKPDISCHYLQFGQSACMFRISQSFQCRQDRRYIAAIVNWHGGVKDIKKAWTISNNPRLLA